jgi:mono/diheme cytochrome c family protein
MCVFRSLPFFSVWAVMVGSVVSAADSAGSVSYHGDVFRLMQKHCIQCHRNDGVAPFSLESFEEVEANAPMIQEVIRRGTMPPWYAAEVSDGQRSPWANERVLTISEKETLAAWIRAGRPEGNAEDAPEPLEFSAGWQIDADSIYEAPAVHVKATGVMPYEYILIDTKESQDRWIDGIEIRPSAPQAVHHVLAFVVPPGQDPRKMNGINYWGVYAPGSGAQVYPEGYARKLPKDSKILLSMHYTPTGEAVVDRTQIAVRRASKAPEFEVRTTSVANTDFTIPAGAENYEITAKVRWPRDVRVLGYLPHSHLRGTAARYEVVSRSGDSEILLDVPRYDFNWQLFYRYREPRTVPAGSTVKYTAWYDNSENNPANPDPTQDVEWGDQTFEEMHLGYVEFVVPRNP